MVKRNLRWVASVAAIFALLVGVRAGATANAHKTTYLTFSRSVQLPGVSLHSGTYVFEIANPDTGGDVVRVLSRDRTASYFMGFTRPFNRPPATRGQSVSLGESAAGGAAPITVWWPEGESTGRQFVYPGAR